MSFHIRTNISLYYRLFFVTLFLVSGLSAMGIVLLESFADISIITTESEIDKKFLLAILSILGFSVTCTAVLLIYFMREKRYSRADRRQQSISSVYPGHRSNIDRRNMRSNLDLS